MGSQPHYVIPLSDVNRSQEPLVGGKSARLGTLAEAGHPIAPGFCVTIRAYELFLAESRLENLIHMELDRKRFEDMRWEEIWDAALRIRSTFLANPVPTAVASAVADALEPYPPDLAWAVRSSAPGEDSAILVALRDRFAGVVVLPDETEIGGVATSARPNETPRQLIGQPAAPGLETGKVRCIRSSEDLGLFEAGEVLVCDAIQPMMTHLVPLACAIVERRGGMLIHGAIIARELGIPCVNGIPDVVSVLKDADLVTVDGYLGIVTIGLPEFDMELAEAR